MILRFYITSIVVFLVSAVSPDCMLAAGPTPPTVGELELKIAALTTMNEMQLSSDQVTAITKIAVVDNGAMAPVAEVVVDNTGQYRLALVRLRDALLARLKADVDDTQFAGIEKNIDDSQNIVNGLRAKLHITPAAKITITDDAKKNSDRALQQLTSGQIADYLAIHASEVRDATEPVLDALVECRNNLNPADFDHLCQQTAEDADFLSEGYNGRRADVIKTKVTALLTRVHGLSNAAFDNQLTRLENQARATVAPVDHFATLRHWMDGEMACLLSNPQLGN